jgi:hypothetical protein
LGRKKQNKKARPQGEIGLDDKAVIGEMLYLGGITPPPSKLFTNNYE